jgi:hypothetical protein
MATLSLAEPNRAVLGPIATVRVVVVAVELIDALPMVTLSFPDRYPALFPMAMLPEPLLSCAALMPIETVPTAVVAA